MKNESVFKVGDRVWDCCYGWGVIKPDFKCSNERFPLYVFFESDYKQHYTLDGRTALDCLRTLFFEEIPIPESALKPKRWRAKNRCIFYFISPEQKVIDRTEAYDDHSKALYDTGNYFKTKEEAEQAAEKVKQLLLSL